MLIEGTINLNRRLGTVRVFVQGPRIPRKTDAESPVEIAAKVTLRQTISNLPMLPMGKTRSEQGWLYNRKELRTDILRRDPRYFLRWPVIQREMVARSNAKFVLDTELPLVKSREWLNNLDENSVGCPDLIRGTRTSGNLVHHAYHLIRFADSTKRVVSSFDSVVEIGAGYGSMCRLISRVSGGAMRSTLIDLPEFSALQKYFLDLSGTTATLLTDPSDIQLVNPPSIRLLIATWSLSEIPIFGRSAIVNALGDFDGYLIAFQEAFGEVDNNKYFKEFVLERPDIKWTTERIEHLPRTNSHYLFGVRE